ncbi:MAG: roadblock/LC7 domain-containing protein [Candidatus Aenigmatarchaeota archaeon]
MEGTIDKRQQLENILKELRNVRDIIGSAIARVDGLLIAADLPAEVNSKAVAAMAAAIVGTSETTIQEFKIGNFQQVIVNATEGQYVCIKAGEDAILISLIKKDANLGLVLLEMEKQAKKIERLM